MPDPKRKRLFRDRSQTVGTGPGSLTFVGDRRLDASVVTIIDYDADAVSEQRFESLDSLDQLKDTETVTWVNVSGVHDPDLISGIGERFDIPPLILEDIMNTTQRARAEELERSVYVVVRMLAFDQSAETILVEQVSLVIGENWLLTFQEWEGDVFAGVRERLRAGTGRIRKLGPDYLAHALIDAIVDNYFVVLDGISYLVEQLEEEVLNDPGDDFERRLYNLKRQLVSIRRSIWPSREMTSTLIRTESPIIKESTLPFFRDVYDHAIQVIDIVESLKDVVTSIGESYRTVVGNRMNEIMKVLTIIATIFIPLTFIAGIYGMNFENMPELHYQWGYFIALGGMGLLGIGLALFFKARKWF